jgi:hypothetical protein
LKNHFYTEKSEKENKIRKKEKEKEKNQEKTPNRAGPNRVRGAGAGQHVRITQSNYTIRKHP